MRVAFSGAHRTGKSTLLAEVADRLPAYATVAEPYELLAEDGYECAEIPSLDDFEAQLARSLDALGEAPADALFDRCPADVLAYLATHEDADAFELDDWVDRVRDAMQTLDLVVFVPIEPRDRIAVSAHEDRAWRAAVDAELEALLVDDRLGFAIDVLRVEGDVAARVEQVLARVGAR